MAAANSHVFLTAHNGPQSPCAGDFLTAHNGPESPCALDEIFLELIENFIIL
jgi:hypothetical protein